MREGMIVKLSWMAINSGLYPPSMKGQMIVDKLPRNTGPRAKVDVLCEDNQIRTADLHDLEAVK